MSKSTQRNYLIKIKKMSEESRDSNEAGSAAIVESDIIPGYASIEKFTEDGFKTLMEAIKHSSALPSGRDWNFYNTSESFKKIINDESSNVLRLMNQVMRNHEVDSNIRNRILDEKIELIIEANDVILEKVANNLDELNGLRTEAPPPVVLQTVSAQLPVNGSWNRPNAATFAVNSKAGQSGEQNCIRLLTGKNIVRPQKLFRDKIDNRNKIPWYPRITDKPNSLKPLAIFLEECEDRQEYSHPYEFELDRFTPTPEQLLEEKPKPSRPLKDTPLIEINKPEQLEELVETLRTCKEIAIDIEHHSYRSFMGFTCLLQISTKDKDYLIDALILRDKLHVLNEVFTKNTIVKIFHGADRDVEWLQRDLSIYVINMFDTHQAAKVLQYQGLSLAFLMKKFCNVHPNKEFQLADWRIRPLPNELKEYAREDTHYLIYIYQMLKKELLLKANKSDNLLRSVIERSTEICKKRYFKPMLNESSHLDIYRKCKKMFDNRQMYALKEIFFWRDNLAREEDESLGYVLPNHMLLQISENLPREMQGILACCNPIPPLVRSHLLPLHHIILKAREQPLEKAIMKDTTGRGVLKKISEVNVDSALHCPHDLSKTNEFRDDLPTLLQSKQLEMDIKSIGDAELAIEKKSSYSLFGGLFNTNEAFNERKTFKKLRGFAYFSPYERYKLVKPFAVEEDKRAETQKGDTEKTQAQEENKFVPENTSQERTDEERIASIKDHFMQLSRKFSEELQAQQEKEEAEDVQKQRARSLLEMGGSRKRKRGNESDYLLPDQSAINNNLHCPIPNVNYNAMQFYGRKGKGKKRKFNQAPNNDEGEQPKEGEPKSKKKKNTFNEQQRHFQNQQQQQQNLPQGQRNVRKAQRKLQHTQQQQHLQQQQSPQQQQHVQQQRLQKQQRVQKQQRLQQQRVQQQQQYTQQQQPQVQQQQQPQHQNQQQQPKKKNINKTQRGGFQRFQGGQNGPRPNNKKNKAGPTAGGRNNNANFSPYDYASVDFRQFQGGAGSANTGMQIKNNFKPKNRRHKNKNGAKSATFANTTPNRGGHQTRNF